MNWKNRLTNYNFWISIFSACLLILQALKIEFDIAYVNEIFTAVLGLLVVIGIISDPTRTTVKSTENTNQSSAKSDQETVSKEKIEDNASIKTEKPETSENVLPIEQANEVNNVHLENDLQIVLNKITKAVDEKMKEFELFNVETLNKMKKTQTTMAFIEDEKEISQISNDGDEKNTPAAAEMINPFVDVIN